MKIGIFVTFFFGSLFASESAVCQRANAHLIIHDYVGAEKECLKGLDDSPDSSLLQKVMIKALAEGGKGDEATTLFERFQLESKEPELLETLAWGIIKQSEGSTQLLVNLACLMSACHTNDVRATDLLLRSLSSSNAVLRTYAAQLSPRYRDQLVIAKLLEMLRLEKVWFVRLEVIRALGMMEVKEARDPLTEILIHPRAPSEEKGEAIAALINSWEEIGDQELAALIRSKRGGFRHLACQIISHLDLKDKSASIEILLEDSIAEVRIAALNTLSFLGLKRLSTQGLSKIVDLTEDPNASVALTAAWIVSRFAPETACQVIKQSIYGTDDATRRLGALILGRIGPAGKRLAEEVLKITPDPFVKANLALGAIGQGGNDTLYADTLHTFLLLRKGKVMWERSSNPLFQVLSPSKICHIPQVTQYPTMVDHLTRLDILKTLAVLNHPKATEAMKQFLREEGYGVSFSASTLLLEEGGEEVYAILRSLLDEKEDHIRIQAALVLALMGGDEKGAQVLQEGYFLVDREMKIHIIGALGHIGDKGSIPFLLKLLEEPYPTLKVMAASALIQCVYH